MICFLLEIISLEMICHLQKKISIKFLIIILNNYEPFFANYIHSLPVKSHIFFKLFTYVQIFRITKPPLASLIQTEKGFVSTGQT